MSQPELVKEVVRVLDGLGIDYMLTGSLVSSIQGEPRSTHDIDLVIQLAADRAGALFGAFGPPDYYLSRAALDDAVRRKTMFNLVDQRGGGKVDFWLLTDEPFDRARFARKLVEPVLGENLKISTPEDTILAKLRWAKLSGGSEKQFTDALRVYELQRDQLDSAYLDRWAGELGVVEWWDRIRAEAEPQ